MPRKSDHALLPEANEHSEPEFSPQKGPTVNRRLAHYIAGPVALKWIGFGLLLVWVCWFGVCIAQQPLPRVVPHQPEYYKNRRTYILLHPFMGMDFHHNYTAVRAWRRGGDPYAELRGDPANVRYVYPPLTLFAFSWADLFPPGPVMTFTNSQGAASTFATSKPAILTWLAASVGILSLAAGTSWKVRSHLGLRALPLPFVLAATFVSYPVIFELERGNCNVVPLLGIVGLVAALNWRDQWRGDVVAGLCVAVAMGIKPYAIILFLGLAALRRWRAAAFGVAWLLLEAVVLSPDLQRWLLVAQFYNKTELPVYYDFSHSIIAHWQLVWRDLGWPALAKAPAQRVVGCILLLVTLTVGWQVFRRGGRPAIAWPFLLWLTAVGTMLTPIAHDYNLIFIPLAVLGAWSAADSWRVQLCVCAVLLWWQPFFLGFANLPLLLLKVISVLLVGILIVRRCKDRPVELAMDKTAVA